MKKKIRFIYNPISGILPNVIWEDTIAAYLDLQAFEFDVTLSEYAAHTTILAKQAAESGYDIVCAIGGDGTVNEVINGIAGSSVALAIIPTGSGNGVSNHIQLKPRKIKQAISVINACRIDEMDLVKTNLKWLASVSGIGYEAHITRRFRKSGKRGLISYVKAAVFQFFAGKSAESLSIDIDSKTYEGIFFMFSVFNSNQYGYNVGFTENTSIHDGKLDIVFLKPFPIYRLPINLAALFLRKPKWSKDLLQIQGEQIKVKNQSELLIQMDGDPIMVTGDVFYTLYPNYLKIIIPPHLKQW